MCCAFSLVDTPLHAVLHCAVQANDLQMIVRAHECVMDGFERFAQGHLITLFSATNYCGTANNAGAILVLGRDLVSGCPCPAACCAAVAAGPVWLACFCYGSFM